jgi:hypothetical protein
MAHESAPVRTALIFCVDMRVGLFCRDPRVVDLGGVTLRDATSLSSSAGGGSAVSAHLFPLSVPATIPSCVASPPRWPSIGFSCADPGLSGAGVSRWAGAGGRCPVRACARSFHDLSKDLTEATPRPALVDVPLDHGHALRPAGCNDTVAAFALCKRRYGVRDGERVAGALAAQPWDRAGAGPWDRVGADADADEAGADAIPKPNSDRCPGARPPT